MWAKIIILGLMVMSLGYSLAKDGEPKEGTYSFKTTFVGVLIYAVLLFISWN